MKIPVLRPAVNDERGNSRMTAVWQRLSRYWSVIRIERAPRQLHVRETLQIGEKRQLLVVDVGERQLLIGAAARPANQTGSALARYSDDRESSAGARALSCHRN